MVILVVVTEPHMDRDTPLRVFHTWSLMGTETSIRALPRPSWDRLKHNRCRSRTPLMGVNEVFPRN